MTGLLRLLSQKILICYILCKKFPENTMSMKNSVKKEIIINQFTTISEMKHLKVLLGHRLNFLNC